MTLSVKCYSFRMVYVNVLYLVAGRHLVTKWERGTYFKLDDF